METAQERFERAWGHVSVERKLRGWDSQPEERRKRRYSPHIDSEETVTNIYSELYEEVYE
ncbi:hypothetical protein SEA_WEASELS2_68 [Rhodococcus phage Weasels2]|uniref:Uncharacterized protein n=1 Tax=Rhodococcus phage Weasels2 TaxID=1897437 RepID=A0A1I9SA51_9CAUD|nr:hypothetical protein FDH04_gp068 [Rhodococcus phage Weasels2]AOZ63657.1 hypothetical protein SEA_WEASELS2_68 [Rhodococcus phage Weasels2]